MKKIINFKIESIDPLGQGVCKIDGVTTFIPKTLPEENGSANIYRQAKGVQFALMQELDNKSSLRIEPQCPHYADCNGCDFLHTDYKSELNFKRKSFEHLFAKLENFAQNVDVIGAPDRFNYRNRIQLHYDLRKRMIGMINPRTKKIVEIPHCKTITPSISKKLEELYYNNNWINLLKQKDGRAPHRGHVELYDMKNGVQIEWNKRYAHGGFTQVNNEMNDLLREMVAQKIDSEDSILELFGGNGNLTEKANYKFNTIVDLYHKLPDSSDKRRFLHCDLFNYTSLEEIKAQIDYDIDLLILDPPRKGLPSLKVWLDFFSPRRVIYVSCNPATMVRDLLNCCDKYRPTNPVLFDLFPSTNHFETMVELELI